MVGHVDNSAFPKIKIAIRATFTVLKFAKGRVPIILQFGFGFQFGFGRKGGAKSSQQQALDKGWGYGEIVHDSIQPDNSRLREGIIGSQKVLESLAGIAGIRNLPIKLFWEVSAAE